MTYIKDEKSNYFLFFKTKARAGEEGTTSVVDKDHRHTLYYGFTNRQAINHWPHILGKTNL